MAEELFALTADQVSRLRRLLDSVETGDNPSLRNGGRRQLYPSRIIIGRLNGQISATTGLLSKPKGGTMSVYGFTSTGSTDSGIDETVWNFAPQAATTDRWTIAERNDYTGQFIITTQFCT